MDRFIVCKVVNLFTIQLLPRCQSTCFERGSDFHWPDMSRERHRGFVLTTLACVVREYFNDAIVCYESTNLVLTRVLYSLASYAMEIGNLTNCQ